MKKAILVLIAAMLIPSYAEAGGRYGSAGCGLGSMLITKEGFLQIFAGTTNTIFGSQTFGITSGTSNCTSAGIVKADRQREAFTEAVLPKILEDMAAGDGEYINALGELYGCQNDGLSKFSRTAQDNMAEICKGDSCSSAANFLTSLEMNMAADQDLVAQCPQIVIAN